MKLLKGVAYSLICCTALAGPAMAVEPDAPEQLITRLDAVGLEVQKRLTASFSAASESQYEKNEHGALVSFYADHDHTPVWVDTYGLTDKARATMKEIARAADYGLKPADYPLPTLERADTGTKIPAARLAKAEIMMNRAALAYIRDARGGRIPPQSISRNLDPTLNLPDPLETMEQIAKLDDPSEYLRGFHPKNPQFEALRQVMLKMRGGPTQEKRAVIPNGPAIKPGQKHPQVAVLRERLKLPITQDEAAGDIALYDASVVAAVKKFQKSRGLNPDGVIGPATRRAMNGGTVPKNRYKTILTNMERWRWMPDDLSQRHVQVNVPEFRVRVIENGKNLFAERVVVGNTKNATPIFSDEMEYIAFNPYWNVPNSIKVAEILPYLRRGGGGGGWFGAASRRPSILARHNLFVKYRGRAVDAGSINWNRVDIRSYQFYQPPGGRNVLGDVKFMFPNKHSVYLHDTPTKNLFNKQVRAYSHGCVRVRNPHKLAQVLLGPEGWSANRISGAIGTGKNQHVRLKRKIPVHLTYFTARVEPSGKITYFSDLYGYDSRMARALKL